MYDEFHLSRTQQSIPYGGFTFGRGGMVVCLGVFSSMMPCLRDWGILKSMPCILYLGYSMMVLISKGVSIMIKLVIDCFPSRL